jgi:hypothetical protein
MHHTIWLQTNRTDPLPHLLVDPLLYDFLLAALQRMRSSALAEFASGNTNETARERQIQMELYRSATSCVPSNVFIIPELRVAMTNGFVDLNITGAGVDWLWELLVNGDDAAEHQSRFEPGGKYHSRVKQSTRFVLIDFRQGRGIRKTRPGFVYVCFSGDYSEATVSNLPSGDKVIKLAE